MARPRTRVPDAIAIYSPLDLAPDLRRLLEQTDWQLPDSAITKLLSLVTDYERRCVLIEASHLVAKKIGREDGNGKVRDTSALTRLQRAMSTCVKE